MQPLAFSYIRFSSPEQAKGDSLRRQAEAAADWCRRHKVRLDTSLTLHDLGKSAFLGGHRKNPDRHALAAFLKLVEDGRVPRGSYLVIENLDRLTREHIQPALLLALNLLQAGVRIVQLKPAEMVFDDRSDTLPVMMMMMELARGHGESAIKSERVGAAWQQKKKRARENGGVMTRNLPAWVEERGGKLHLIPARAAAVKRIFALAAAGYGHALIVRRFTGEKVPGFGPSGRWIRSYVAKILSDRRALGEFQPRDNAGRPDGPPIAGYFPAAVTEGEWLAGRAGAAERQKKPGRTGDHVNVFANLLRSARDGEPYYVGTVGENGVTRRMLINRAAVEKRATYYTFPFATFEAALLSLLAEVNPHDILNGGDGPDESLVLAGELAQVEASIALIVADMDTHGESPALFRRLRAKEEQQRTLVVKLAEARQKAAHPLSEAWGEAQTLLSAVDNAPDPSDARLRLRSILRRVIDSVWVLVVPRGRQRLCAVQVWFAKGEKHRDYIILHRTPRGNQHGRAEGGWRAHSLADVADPAALDLRKPGDAAGLERVLGTLDLGRFLKAPGDSGLPGDNSPL
jgi:DNA invertase Pin-like site-specific DNA recombinase